MTTSEVVRPRDLPPIVKTAARIAEIPHPLIEGWEFERDVSHRFFTVGIRLVGMPPVRIVVATEVTIATGKEESK